MYLHKLAGFEISADFRRDMCQFNRGMKRKVAEQRENSGSSLEEGKKAMNIEVYKMMCKKLFESGHEDAALAHLYLVLEWNLMARADNIVYTHVAHMKDQRSVYLFILESTPISRGREGAPQLEV